MKISWFKIALIILPALRAGIKNVEEAVEVDSDEGVKVSKEEAIDIATAILSELHEPLIEYILSNNKED